MKPNFIFIGTGKAGSTWLFEALQRHPEVFVAPVKDTNFFNLNFHRGLPWYEEFFAGATQAAVGEISHRYIRDPQVAQRIRDTLGPVKLLAVFRRPDDYVLSNYLFACRNGRFDGSIEQWMAQRFEPEALRYHSLLAPFVAAVGRDHVHLACFDDLVEAPESFLGGICDFLGVARRGLPGALSDRVNAAARPRWRALALGVNRVSKFFKRRGGERLIAWVKRRRWVRAALYRPLDELQRPALPQQVRDAVRAIAEPEIRRLDDQFGTRLWQRWYAA